MPRAALTYSVLPISSREEEIMTGQGKMKDQTQSRALEGLPVKFVSAMRTLFDVLDDNKTGSVSLADIEHWWRKDREEQGGTGGIPNGVIESLR